MILLVSVLLNCDMDQKTDQRYSKILTRNRGVSNPRTFGNVSMKNCEDYVVLMSANKLAKRLERSKDWIIANYQIPLYADTLVREKRIIGSAPPGSHCYIVEHKGLWFHIQTPGDNELGWLHQDFVVGFVKKNPETLRPCPEIIS